VRLGDYGKKDKVVLLDAYLPAAAYSRDWLLVSRVNSSPQRAKMEATRKELV